MIVNYFKLVAASTAFLIIIQIILFGIDRKIDLNIFVLLSPVIFFVINCILLGIIIVFKPEWLDEN